MNELKELESQLLSWKPRRPSANLRQRLFGEPKPQLRRAEDRAPYLRACCLPAFAIGRWLAPAMALFILGVVYLGTTPPYLESSSRLGLMATVDLSQPHLGTAYAASAPSDRNVWDVTSFEWTNAGHPFQVYPR